MTATTATRKVLSAALAAAVTVGSLPMLAAPAAAAGGHRPGIAKPYYGAPHASPYRGGERYGHGYGYRRHRDHTGRNVAIGAFATILGLALAAEANRVHDDYYRD